MPNPPKTYRQLIKKKLQRDRPRAARHDPNPQNKRLSPSGRGYDRRWERYRSWFLRQPKNIMCVGCGNVAEEVDHIRPPKDRNDPLFWVESNHQPLCHECHSIKTYHFDGAFGREKRKFSIQSFREILQALGDETEPF